MNYNKSFADIEKPIKLLKKCVRKSRLSSRLQGAAQARSQTNISGVAKLYWVNHVVQNEEDCILGKFTLHYDWVKVLVKNGSKR